MATLLAQLCYDSCCYGNFIGGLIYPIITKSCRGTVNYMAM